VQVELLEVLQMYRLVLRRTLKFSLGRLAVMIAPVTTAMVLLLMFLLVLMQSCSRIIMMFGN
jgi:hypothetical protein